MTADQHNETCIAQMRMDAPHYRCQCVCHDETADQTPAASLDEAREPTTEAGRQMLVDAYRGSCRDCYGTRIINGHRREHHGLVVDIDAAEILAIEAEARATAKEQWDLAAIDAEALIRAATLQAVRERVEALDRFKPDAYKMKSWPHTGAWVRIDFVLAALSAEGARDE